MTRANSVKINEGKGRTDAAGGDLRCSLIRKWPRCAGAPAKRLHHAAEGLERPHFGCEGLVAGQAMGDYDRRVTSAESHFAPSPAGRLAPGKELEDTIVKPDGSHFRRWAEPEVGRQILIESDIPEVVYFQFDTGDRLLRGDANQAGTPGERQELEHDAQRNRANEGCDQHVVHRGTVCGF